MSKNTIFTGQPILNQLLELIPRSLVKELSSKHGADRYCKKFMAEDHLTTMLYCCFNRCSSLRELVTGLQVNMFRLRHIGFKHTPRRSTLADANSRRSEAMFGDLFHRLYHRYYGNIPDSPTITDEDKLFSIDSTTITLFSQVMKGAGTYGIDGKKKGGAKAHVMYNHADDLPCYVWITEAKVHDQDFMKRIDLPPGSTVVMDKGYKVYNILLKWTDNNIRWVTRLNNRAVWEIKQEKEVSEADKEKGVRQDYIISLGNPRTTKKNPIQTVRLVFYYDKTLNQIFRFISNDLNCSPMEIADLYKARWKIELLFKRIKQNFPLRDFLGDNVNAIKIQIWCSLIADLLTKIIQDKVQKVSKRLWSFTNLAGLIRQHLNTYINLIAFLSNPDKALLAYQPPDPVIQMELFKRGAYF